MDEKSNAAVDKRIDKRLTDAEARVLALEIRVDLLERDYD